RTDPNTGLPMLSETAILRDAKSLSEVSYRAENTTKTRYLYRIVGTKEHAHAEDWMLGRLHQLKAECDRLGKLRGGLECEVVRQVGSGSHRFDMMGRRVDKLYTNVTNLIFRLSNGTPSGKEHALLVNAHLDSTLPSPGAADDALPSAIMLDCIRVLIQTLGWSPASAIIFLWNNAEESLQDGSHLFSTQGEMGGTARAVLNLEAAGVSGPELLFQATSEEMIEAYSHVPRPYGTVLANDIFSSGIILSDTDFRQFQEYRNLTGLDIAIVGGSYLYHTRRDIVANIHPGVTQHMAENVLALLKYLSSPASPIPRLSTFSPPQTTYFTLFGTYFLSWPFSVAQQLHNALLVLSLALAYSSAPVGISIVEYFHGSIYTLAAILGAATGANVVAGFMAYVAKRKMSWFAREWYAAALYVGPAMFGQHRSGLFHRSAASEVVSFTSVHLFFVSLAVGLQYAGVGSSAIGFLWGLSSFLALCYYVAPARRDSEGLPLVSYLIAQIIPASLGGETAAVLLEIFVPLTGRTGDEAPSEHIVASIVAISVFLVVPHAISFSWRLSRRFLRRVLAILGAISILIIIVFATGCIAIFDELHPRRLFILHSEDLLSGERSLHVSVADSAPGVLGLVSDIADRFGATGMPDPRAVAMDEWNVDWDVLYPFSQFLTPFKIPLPTARRSAGSDQHDNGDDAIATLRVFAEMDQYDAFNGKRELHLVIEHPGIIWPVIAFDAHILSWNLNSTPPPDYARHHIKEASFYGVNKWQISFVLNVTSGGVHPPPLPIQFQGIQEKGMWPGKILERDAARGAMDLFEQIDGWLQHRDDGVVYDAMMLGCITGAVEI
ncbi:uncharacterized protein EI90DRAFT_2923234, partial [Cantharellus anzutake]|uniref:uncharacterized protein n=1 Tax=Cantharellus anzutake TaxID=1750568 RepID=UPI001907255C